MPISEFHLCSLCERYHMFQKGGEKALCPSTLFPPCIPALQPTQLSLQALPSLEHFHTLRRGRFILALFTGMCCCLYIQTIWLPSPVDGAGGLGQHQLFPQKKSPVVSRIIPRTSSEHSEWWGYMSAQAYIFRSRCKQTKEAM